MENKIIECIKKWGGVEKTCINPALVWEDLNLSCTCVTEILKTGETRSFGCRHDTIEKFLWC